MILTPDDLSAMLKLPRRTVLESITKQPGFPESVTGNRKPRWLGEEIQKWLKRKSAQNANMAP